MARVQKAGTSTRKAPAPHGAKRASQASTSSRTGGRATAARPAPKAAPARKASTPAKKVVATKKLVAKKAAPPAKKVVAVAKKMSAPARKATPPAKKPLARKPEVKARPVKVAAKNAATQAPAAKTAVAVKKTVAPAVKVPAAKAAVQAAPARAVPAAVKAPAPVFKPVVARRKGPLDKFLLEQRDLLNEERASYVRQADDLKAEADLLATEMEPGESEFGEEGGEGGNLSVERELDLRLSAQARTAVIEIDQALAKIEAGTYGMCEKCGQPIPKARLRALPAAPLCVACKSGGLSRR